MKIAGVYISVVAAVGALVVVVWIGRNETQSLSRVSVGEEAIPTPSKSGPHPQAVTDETEHDFGVMQQGAKGEHTFIIRNEGKARLKMVALKEDSSCQCTVGKLGKDGLAPGESTEVTLAWTIKGRNPIFQHYAAVRTNDPERTQIPLKIRGKVGKLLHIKPELTWYLGQVSGDREIEFTGTLHSELVDDFKILRIESTSPLVSAEIEPLARQELDKLVINMTFPRENQTPIQASLPMPTCGYSIKVTVQPGIPVGGFQERLTFHTDIEGATIAGVYVTALRAGPFEIFSLKNCIWASKTMLLRMGKFSATTGSTAQTMMFVKGMDEDMQVLDIKTELEFLKVKVERDSKFSAENTQRFLMSVEVPPGSPPVNCSRSNRTKISIKTNHPTAPRLDIRVEFVSTALQGR